MQPLALKQIHNTNSAVTGVVASVFAASQDGNEATVGERLTACLQHSCLKNAFFSPHQCTGNKLMCVFFKQRRWWAPTEDVFLMICSDIQLELTLQSDMDHWVYRASSELTSGDLSSLLSLSLSAALSSLSLANQIKNSFIGMNGSWIKNVVEHLSLEQYSTIRHK